MALRRGTKASGSRAPAPLHELEAEVMEELWRSGESSVRAVMEGLNKRTDKDRAYTTYMTVMARLHEKGLLVRRREGKGDYYASAYDRDEYMALRAGSEVDDLVSQYGEVALAHSRSTWQSSIRLAGGPSSVSRASPDNPRPRLP